MVTDEDTVVGGVQDPKLPKLKVVTASTDEKDFVAVTVTYFFRRAPPLQLERQLTATPETHSQKTLLVAVTPLRPVAFCAVVLMAVELPGWKLPYCAPSRAPCNKADFCRL